MRYKTSRTVIGAALVASFAFGATTLWGASAQDMPSFQEMDKDGNGKISREEFSEITHPNQQSQLWDKTINEIEGRTVLNANGKEIGEVEAVAYNQRTDKVNVIIGVGGFLGLGEAKVAIPLDEITFQGEKVQWSTRYSEDQLKEKYSYRENDHRELHENMRLSAVRDGVFQEDKKEGQRVSKQSNKEIEKRFDELDQNGDGTLTKEEAQQGKADNITENWAQADENNNDILEKSEFSAFEMRQQMND